MTRLLGATWASVHGPGDPRRLALWTLELGFAGITAGPAPRSIDWVALRAALTDLPFEFGSEWRLAAPADAVGRADADLCARRAGAVATSVAAVQGAVEQAARIGLSGLLLEPGQIDLGIEAGELDLADNRLDWGAERLQPLLERRDGLRDEALDRACRTLHRICRAYPDRRFSLGLSSSLAGLGEPEGLEAIFEDLASCQLGYWHEPAIAACREQRLGEPQGESMERFASRLTGSTVADWGDGELLMPPGAGLVDFPLVASYLKRRASEMPLVLELDPGLPPGEIPGIHSFLSKFGL